MATVNSSRFNLKEDIDWMIMQYLRDYSGEVVGIMTTVIPEVAKEATKKLKATSPKKSGTYRKGWRYKVEKGRLTVGATIYGEYGTYQLAHLLEHGHALRQGGRSRAIVHIKPVEEWAVDEAIDRTIERLEGM